MGLLNQTKRRWVQAISLLALNSNFRGVPQLGGCLPVLNCQYCHLAWLGCPIGMIGVSLAAGAFPWLVLGILLVAGLMVGRFFCGWVCPAGFIQDLLYRIPSPKFRLPRPLVWIKYAVLLVMVVGAAWFLGQGSLLYFCNVCPVSTTTVELPWMVMAGDYALDTGGVLRVSLLVIVILLVVGNHRGFCKVFCPLGALMAVTNRFSLYSIRIKRDACVRCEQCDQACPMGVPVMRSQDRTGTVNSDTECIECLACKKVCPTSAIIDDFHHAGRQPSRSTPCSPLSGRNAGS